MMMKTSCFSVDREEPPFLTLTVYPSISNIDSKANEADEDAWGCQIDAFVDVHKASCTTVYFYISHLAWLSSFLCSYETRRNKRGARACE